MSINIETIRTKDKLLISIPPKILKASKLLKDEVLELLSSIINQIKFYEEDLISIGSSAVFAGSRLLLICRAGVRRGKVVRTQNV